MPKQSVAVIRKPRADAQLNRERILLVSRKIFSRLGEDVKMDDIAKEAGVGPGTLYRHFPTRDKLIIAVYRTEVEKLAAAEKEFVRVMPPIAALRAWLLLFVDYLATKQLIAPALNIILGGPAEACAISRDHILEAIHSLAKRAIESGDLRPDIAPEDLLHALAGISCTSPESEWTERAKRLVEILILGSRPH